jgi:hypothetical protein
VLNRCWLFARRISDSGEGAKVVDQVGYQEVAANRAAASSFAVRAKLGRNGLD